MTLNPKDHTLLQISYTLLSQDILIRSNDRKKKILQENMGKMIKDLPRKYSPSLSQSMMPDPAF